MTKIKWTNGQTMIYKTTQNSKDRVTHAPLYSLY